MISEAYYLLAEKQKYDDLKYLLLEKSLEYDRTNRKTRRDLANLMFSLKNYKDALENFKLIPDSGEVQLCFEELQKLNPNDF